MIKPLATAMVWLLMCGCAAAANNAPASDASIREMLELTNAQQLIASMKGQMTTMMNSTMQNATRGQTVTPERQAILDRMAAKMSAVAADQDKMQAIQKESMQEFKDLKDKEDAKK
jgi:uncharacterized protein